MIDAEYDELDDAHAELDLADTDSLPWLESDEEDEHAGGFDAGQLMGLAAALVLLLGAVVGGVWFLSNKAADTVTVAQGGVIAAPVGPIKQKPDNPGGKTFDGTGNVAPVVGEGGTRPAVVADTTPPEPTTPVTKPSPIAGATAAAQADLSGVGVQLAAYGTRARAEQGWSEVSRRTDKLAGVKYRVVEGRVDSGTVFRLQAVTADRAAADRLCAALKADGLDCQVKP